MKGQQIAYSVQELAWIEANRAIPRREAHARFVAQFGREDVNAANFKALCTRKGWTTGRDGRFEKGGEALNKGKPCAPGRGANHPNAVRNRFKPGVRQGVAKKLYKPIGTERFSKEGYLERKIHDGMPLQSRWRAVHIVNWEAINGPVPKGHCLKCLDGDKLNTDPSNWALVSRAVNCRLGGRNRIKFDQTEPELKPAVMMVAKIKQAVKEAAKA